MESKQDINIKNQIEELRDNLLDMSLNNHLLNFRPRKKSIAIYDEDIAELYDLLVLKEKKMEFLSNETLDQTVLEDNTWYIDSEVKDVHKDLFLNTNYVSDELKKKLSKLYNDNKTSLEEKGYNSLYLALGFLEWSESNYSKKFHKAPLILIPMNLSRSSISTPFKICWNGDDIKSNISLQYKLLDQNIDLPLFEEFEEKIELKEYLQKVKESIKNEPNWKVSTDIYLSDFSFKKFVMYKDLDLEQWKNIESNKISEIFEVADEFEDYCEEDFYEEDSIIALSSSDIFNVVDADSSQLAVLDEIKKGRNLVVEGPPGTGKSQTIVNIIAELMARDKKVLFVSEKRAALDVVKSRLDAIGLGDGCLELHGRNSNKKEVLNELERTLNLDSIELNEQTQFNNLDSIKEDLNHYVDSLHNDYRYTGLTPYNLIGLYENACQSLEHNNQNFLRFDIDDVGNLNKERRGSIIKNLKDIKTYYDLVEPVTENIWNNTNPINISSPDVDYIKQDLNSLISEIEHYEQLTEQLSLLTGIEKVDNFNISPIIEKSKILKPNLKLLNKEDNVTELITNIYECKDKSNRLNLNINLDNLKEELTSLINTKLMDKEVINKYSEFKQLSSETRLLKNEYKLGQIFNDISKIQDIIKSINLTENVNLIDLKGKIGSLNKNINNITTDLDFTNENKFKLILNEFNYLNDNISILLEDIEKFQIKSVNLDLNILELDLDDLKQEGEDLLSNINSLNINSEITEDNLFKSNLSDFKVNKKTIEKSNLEDALEDPELDIKLREFKSKKDSFIKRTFSSNFKTISQQFHSYYDYEVSNDKIVEDLENLIKINKDLTKLRNKILAHCKNDISDDKIIIESENLLNWVSDIDNIKEKLSGYQINVSTNKLNNKLNDLIELKKLHNSLQIKNKEYSNNFEEINQKLDDYKIEITNNVLNAKIIKLNEIKQLLDYIISKNDVGAYYFHENWKSHSSDTSILNKELTNIQSFTNEYELGTFNSKTIDFINENRFDELKIITLDLESTKNNILRLYKKLNSKLNFRNEFNFTSDDFKLNAEFNNITTTSRDFVKVNDFKLLWVELLENINSLHDFRLFIHYCNQYSNQFNEDLINAVKNDEVISDNIVDLFYYNFTKKALDDVFLNSNVLDTFSYKIHEAKIEEFKKLDEQVMDLNKYRVKEVLGKNRPNISKGFNLNSNLGVLTHEFGKKRKLLPIRKLLSKTYDVISDIKPCFMMSPLSIAQYLSPEVFESYFDYIIFDEASQVKVEDAIGAMLRGKHYIVMGDTKQLPPTTFFETELDIDEDEDDENFNYAKDNESILHLCKNTFYTKMLKWHYRSKHESLISVSNMEFYNNDLYVFPSPMRRHEDLGLKFEYDSTTVYAKGEGSKNIKEAENIVEYAFDCVRKYGNEKSIGIGTFSSRQRDAIMDVLELKLKEHPELEQFFIETGKEGFFIKNLENIQGDERDIILISMGYGKDQNGNLSLNFGPLNREGGERRLNVLISRAREKCVVFTNFKASEMSIERTNSKGVKALQTFLYYAETGEFPDNYSTGEDFDSEFEMSVYSFLTDEGFIVEKQVGCAGYKIDLAIVDNDDPDRYVLAIECDGAMYHSSRLARDRDRLRQQILESKGWKFYRIWSTDWYHARSSAKERLLNKVKEAMDNKDVINLANNYESGFTPNLTVKSNEDKLKEELDNYFEDYNYYQYDSSHGDIHNIILKIIETESPININDLYDRVKALTGEKATQRFKRGVDQIAYEHSYYNRIDNDGEYYYSKNFCWDDLKVRKRISPKIDRISKKELQKAIIFTLKLEYSSPKNALMKSVSSYLGFNSLRQNIKEVLNNIVMEMLLNETIKENINGNLELNE